MSHTKNKKLSEFGKKGARIRWDKHQKKIKDHLKSIDRPEYSILKARLCGFLAGDGTVACRRENKKQNIIHYTVNFYPDHISMVKSFLEAFEKLYQKRPAIKKEKNYYRIRTKCKFACLDLLNNSKFGIYTWEVPFNFLNNHQLKKEWLRAFFDCEGYVGKKQIQVQSVNKKGLHQVKNVLGDFGIESKIYKYKRKNKNWSTNYILNIGKKNMREMFLNKIGFNHKIKLIKLKQQFYKPASDN